MCGEMVQATLRDVNPKTETRRIGKIQSRHHVGLGVAYHHHATKGLEAVATYDAFPGKGTARWAICECPYGVPGDRLWVRETFARVHDGLLQHLDPDPDNGEEFNNGWSTVFRADGEPAHWEHYGIPWKPSIFLPRQLSRITLEIVKVRVERLQDISDRDALAEGVTRRTEEDTPFRAYRDLWKFLNGPGSWDENPWVWVIGFKRV